MPSLEENGWQVSGVRSAERFFRALPRLVPEATHVFLEGTPAPDIVALLSEAPVEYKPRPGTIWSWPRSRRLGTRASAALFDRLSNAASRLAEPEVCDHLHLYRDDEPLLQWFDAFNDPLLISKAIPRERISEFCAATGGTLSD